ncbi:MAG: segregation/condensation protein A [Burkholderiales bacterium]|nr:segregation/condensation protein A [Burkholderiales bacterium]
MTADLAELALEAPSAAPAADAAGAPAAPRARLYGEPLLELPRDLYIPPDALEVFLDTFEGPLDLLLYLIRRQNFNILDIPMARVTAQYLEYVDQIRSHNLELAAEYLLMAALLIEIKSRMLLPVQKASEDGEAEDPRAELVRRLLEYERIKRAAQQLEAVPMVGREIWPVQVALETALSVALPRVDADDLRLAWLAVVRRAKLTQHHHIGRAELSVRAHMSLILRRLGGTRFLEFAELFEGVVTLPVAVVHFLALLELTREGLIEITQAEAYAPIYIRLSYTPS